MSNNINLGGLHSPNTSGGGLGFLSDLLGSLNQGKQANEGAAEKKQQFTTDQAAAAQKAQIQSQQIQENDETMAAAKASQAKQRGDQVLQQVYADPSGRRGSDPLIQKAVIDSLTAQGLPVPRDAKGNIDYQALRPSVGDMFKDPKAVTAFMQQPKDVRAGIASQYSDFPKSIVNAAQQSDLRGEAALTRAQAYAKNLPNVTKIADAREHAQAAMYGDIGNMDTAHAILYAHDAKKADADASAVMIRAQALTSRADSYAQSVHNAVQKTQNGDRGAAAIVLRSADSELRTYNTQIDSLQGEWTKLASDPTVDADDPRLQAIAQAVGKAQATRDNVQTQIDTLRSNVQSGKLTSNFLSGASGQHVTPVNKSKGQTLYNTSQGKPIISTDGGKTWNFS